jgi:hypothetical protein
MSAITAVPSTDQHPLVSRMLTAVALVVAAFALVLSLYAVSDGDSAPATTPVVTVATVPSPPGTLPTGTCHQGPC